MSNSFRVVNLGDGLTRFEHKEYPGLFIIAEKVSKGLLVVYAEEEYQFLLDDTVNSKAGILEELNSWTDNFLEEYKTELQ